MPRGLPALWPCLSRHPHSSRAQGAVPPPGGGPWGPLASLCVLDPMGAGCETPNCPSSPAGNAPSPPSRPSRPEPRLSSDPLPSRTLCPSLWSLSKEPGSRCPSVSADPGSWEPRPRLPSLSTPGHEALDCPSDAGAGAQTAVGQAGVSACPVQRASPLGPDLARARGGWEEERQREGPCPEGVRGTAGRGQLGLRDRVWPCAGRRPGGSTAPQNLQILLVPVCPCPCPHRRCSSQALPW